MRTWIASSESPDQCTYPKGCYFEYCALYQTEEGYELEGKGRYGCVTIVKLTDKQTKEWMALKE